MKQEWGREGYAGDWPSDRRVWTIAAFFVALASVAAIYVYRYERVWTPLQRFYLAQYLNSDTNLRKNTGHYLLLNAANKNGSHLALDEEVTETGESAYALTEEAVKAGDLRLEWQRGQFENAKMRAYLGHWIYRDQTFTDLAKPALWGGLGVFVAGLIVAIPKDAARKRERKEGRRLKGPELVTVAEFNRLNRSDGIGFVQQEQICLRQEQPAAVCRPDWRKRYRFDELLNGLEQSHDLQRLCHRDYRHIRGPRKRPYPGSTQCCSYDDHEFHRQRLERLVPAGWSYIQRLHAS